GGTSNPGLSPDGQSVVRCCSGLSGGELVFNSDGTSTTLGPGFFAYAWLNSRTAIGEVHADPLQQPPLTLGYVSLDDRATVVSLRLTGAFVGTVRCQCLFAPEALTSTTPPTFSPMPANP